MKRKNATRSALFTSIISMLLCVSMLVGTTFAWFTDNVTSGVNQVVAGNLDIELEYSKDASSWKTVEDATELFSDALWEPGHTEVVYLRLSNKGTLALNYQIGINVDNETEGTNVAGQSFRLSDYIQFGVVEGQSTKFADRAAAVAAVDGTSKKLNEGYTKASSMVAGAADAYLALVVYMPETVGNEANYRGTTVPTINLGIKLQATQKTQETDSFGPDYDVLAQGATISAPAPANGEDITLTADDGNGNSVNVASFSIPAGAIADPDKNMEINIIPTDLDTTIVVEDDDEAATYEITVSNIKEGNTDRIKVELQIGTGRTGVKVYHKNTEITDATYNSNDGWVTFYTTSFSPYTVVYDADPVVEDEGGEGNQPADPANLPKANVVYSPEHVNSSLAFGNYGQWSPTPGLEANLESVYTFSCVDTLEEAKNSPYANWYCDFYVMLDQDLGENEIFLGGNYGSFGWVGFHNGETTLEANTEIGLLESVSTNPWTYLDVVNSVGTFICGVGDVNDALAGATFTVMLRLTNPENEAEFYNVATITYTFPGTEVDNSVTDAESLQTALAKGGEVKLGADIDMNGVRVDIPKNTNVTLDLNGHTLTSKDGGEGNWMAIYVDENAELTLVDSVGTGEIISSCYGVYVKQNAKFTMNGGTMTVSGNDTYDMGVVLYSGSFVMNGGTINAKIGVCASNYYKQIDDTLPVNSITIGESAVINASTEDFNCCEGERDAAPDTVILDNRDKS